MVGLKALSTPAEGSLMNGFHDRDSQPHPGQQAHPVPPGCSLQVFGVSAEGTPVRAGLLVENSTHAPIYVPGDEVRVVPVRKDSVRADPSADSKQGLEPNVAFETKFAAAQAGGELHAPTPGSQGLVDLDLGTLPDADAKLERLPSNTPVLRAWGEATGVEQRWRSASEADDPSGMAFQGESYVSNAATVEVGDSDAESKDGSSNPSPSSSLRERGTWSRYPTPTLDDVIATALPMLSAVSSDISESTRPILGDVAGVIGSSASPPSGIIPEAAAGRQMVDGDGGGTDGDGDGDGDGGTDGDDGQDENKRRESASFRPRACAGANDANDESVGEGEGEDDGEGEGHGVGGVERVERVPSLTWNWAVRVQAAAMPRKARLRLYLEQRSSLPSPGLTLEEARDAMKEWTPEMDKSLLELLGAAGIESVSRSCYARVCATSIVPMLHLQQRMSFRMVSRTIPSY